MCSIYGPHGIHLYRSMKLYLPSMLFAWIQTDVVAEIHGYVLDWGRTTVVMDQRETDPEEPIFACANYAGCDSNWSVSGYVSEAIK